MSTPERTYQVRVSVTQVYVVRIPATDSDAAETQVREVLADRDGDPRGVLHLSGTIISKPVGCIA